MLTSSGIAVRCNTLTKNTLTHASVFEILMLLNKFITTIEKITGHLIVIDLFITGVDGAISGNQYVEYTTEGALAFIARSRLAAICGQSKKHPRTRRFERSATGH